MEPVDVNQGNDSFLGLARSDAVGSTFDSIDVLGQGLERSLLNPGGFCRGSVATGVSDLNIHLKNVRRAQKKV